MIKNDDNIGDNVSCTLNMLFDLPQFDIGTLPVVNTVDDTASIDAKPISLSTEQSVDIPNLNELIPNGIGKEMELPPLDDLLKEIGGDGNTVSHRSNEHLAEDESHDDQNDAEHVVMNPVPPIFDATMDTVLTKEEDCTYSTTAVLNTIDDTRNDKEDIVSSANHVAINGVESEMYENEDYTKGLYGNFDDGILSPTVRTDHCITYCSISVICIFKEISCSF